jgi:methylase of polypeptide subunit release factors
MFVVASGHQPNEHVGAPAAWPRYDTRHLDGRGRLLDLGTGPGFLAIALAPRFEATVAMDPEPEMVTAAEAEARGGGRDHRPRRI